MCAIILAARIKVCEYRVPIETVAEVVRLLPGATAWLASSERGIGQSSDSIAIHRLSMNVQATIQLARS